MNNNPNYAAQMMMQLDTTVTLRLITVLEDIEAANDPANIPFYDSLSETLSFMLKPEEMEKVATRDISTDWLATVANQVEDAVGVANPVEYKNGQRMVTLPDELHSEYKSDSDFLGYLYAAGVDSWEGYEQAQDMMND